MQGNWTLLTQVIVWFTLLKHIIKGSDGATNSCVLPPHPSSGRWTIYQNIPSVSAGDSVPGGTILEVNCNNNYQLDGSPSIACIRGKWNPEIGKCLRTCASMHNTTTTSVTCTFKGGTLDSCVNPPVGSRAHFQCASFYEIQGLNKFPVRICSNGQWIGGLPECVPVCGKKAITNDPTLIVGGFNTTSLEYPWQVALYEKKSKVLICGGTLLNQKTILTAAHCVTDESAKLQPKENYVVAVGKTYRRYDDPRDTTAQISSIEQMYIPRQYKGPVQRYFGDIAIIIANRTFVLSLNVQPICTVWDRNFHQSLETPSKTNLAYVSGWGFTSEHKNPSEILKSVKVPIINSHECERTLSEDDVEYLTDDKLCAGFLEAGMSVCKGDSGGGLIAKYSDRYYIIAVVSIAPQATTIVGGCNSQRYGLYTRFSYYLEDFVFDIEIRFRPSHEAVDCTDCFESSVIPGRIGCKLPDHPEFGYWSIDGTSSNQFGPGMLVASGTILKIQCNTNFTLTGESSLFCSDKQWSSTIGRCLIPVKTTIISKSQEYPTNVEILIQCRVDGHPTPKARWLKNGIPIVISNRIRISDDYSLTIMKSTKTDSGVYKCEAENNISAASSNVTIAVDEKYGKFVCENDVHFGDCNRVTGDKNLCSRKDYASYCCRSCFEAGLLPVNHTKT